ncbi:hypothetical protein [Chryseolinea lacunae]|uniref:Anti sigma-E protein RseA N-terminal domain-containing protein n=1 Tax=Chryseolinea lacunae TaxID=2801331 RepID=A0ABS1KRV7_9BACT|nr:hypothetical protein [Chryseolinea lacunae]MBL0741928.1 hypothetical protein [Chryseolinea lacunae]
MNASENEQRLEQLLGEKSFDALTPEEKDFVLKEFGSEEQYTLARKIGRALVNQKTGLSPDPWVLTALQQHLKEKHRPSFWHSVVHAQVPAYAMALVCVLAVAGVWILSSGNNPAPPSIVTTRVVHDTVFVASLPDTVIRNRVVYRDVAMPLQKLNYAAAKTETVGNPPVAQGVTMKDKEELDKLLVSGSD